MFTKYDIGQEIEKLDTKILDIRLFIHMDNPGFKLLNSKNQNLLIDQYNSMIEYKEILEERLDNWRD